MAFAKLFESEKYGQLLLKIDENDEGEPEVRVYAEPPGLGVCSVAIDFKGEAGSYKAQAAFDAMAVQDAERLAAVIFNAAGVDA